jgi:hypothetical protein
VRYIVVPNYCKLVSEIIAIGWWWVQSGKRMGWSEKALSENSYSIPHKPKISSYVSSVSQWYPPVSEKTHMFGQWVDLSGPTKLLLCILPSTAGISGRNFTGSKALFCSRLGTDFGDDQGYKSSFQVLFNGCTWVNGWLRLQMAHLRRCSKDSKTIPKSKTKRKLKGPNMWPYFSIYVWIYKVCICV